MGQKKQLKHAKRSRGAERDVQVLSFSRQCGKHGNHEVDKNNMMLVNREQQLII